MDRRSDTQRGFGRLPPLAWRNLSESKPRLLASAAGAAFAVVLMFMENGFRNALLDGMTRLIRRLDGDVFVVGRNLYTLSIPRSFPRGRLEQARSFDAVDSVVPLWIETRRARWRNPVDGMERRIQVIGIPAGEGAPAITALTGGIALRGGADLVIADRDSRPERVGRFEIGMVSELSGRRVTVAGLFRLGADFQNDGTLVTTESTFLKIFPERLGATGSDDRIDLGIIRVKPGVRPALAARAIRQALPGDVLVLSKDELIAKEMGFWDRVAPIGIVFRIGVAMAFAVGAAICYQVLQADISDRLAEFATLKAAGYSNGRLFVVVLMQAVYLAILGYLVGLGVGIGLFVWVGSATQLPMVIKPALALEVFALTLLMCSVSGVLAARKLANADPASLFS